VNAFSSIYDAIQENASTFIQFGKIISTYVAPVLSTVLGGALTVVGKIAGGVIDVIASVIKVINGLITGAIKGINLLIGAYNAVPFLPNVSKISLPSVSQPSVSGSSVLASIPAMSGGTSAPKITVPTVSGGSLGVSAAAASGSKAAASAATPFTSALSQSGAIRRAEMAAPVNVTVNQGIVGDQQSVQLDRSAGLSK
jgi:hypothetical protein